MRGLSSAWQKAYWLERINYTLCPLVFLLILYEYELIWPALEFVVDLFWLVVPCTRPEWLTSLKHFVPDSLEQWAILAAVCVWFKSRDDRREEGIIRAWQVLLDAHDKSGDGGRKLALEFLNNSKNSLKYGLFGAVYPREDLSRVNLYLANLQTVNLQGANLRAAELTRADLTNANLSAANLRAANLEKANLQGANLTEANLQGAKYNSEEIDSYVNFYPPTKFPEGFDPVAAGMVRANNRSSITNQRNENSFSFFLKRIRALLVTKKQMSF